MKLLFLLVATAFASAAIGADEPAPASSDEIRRLLQQGLFEEEANRDLAKAAAAYSALVERYGQQRAWAATALFRLAEVRAKQGDKAAAIALHQRLITEFPNHDPLAGLSRDRLTALGVPAAAPPTAAVEAATEEEAKELARVREMAKNSPDLINAMNEKTILTPLGDAATRGQSVVAAFLIEQGAKVEGSGKSARPLYYAARNGHKRLVELLLTHKADIDGGGRLYKETALMAAAGSGHGEVVRLLLERGADPDRANHEGRTALHMAVEFGSVEIARALLVAGAKPDPVSLSQVILQSRGNQAQALPEGTPLHRAVIFGSGELARLLLEHGGNPSFADKDGTLLIRALQSDSEAMAPLLVQHGAEVTVADAQGNTPLHHAALRRSAALVRLLLNRGANAGAINQSGQSVVHAAFRFSADSSLSPRRPESPLRATDDGTGSLMKVLEELAPVAEIKTSDRRGQTPLHCAMAFALFPEAHWLIAHGADIQAVDQQGQTPLSMVFGKERLAFEKQYVFPKLAQDRAITGFLRFDKNSGGRDFEANRRSVGARHSEDNPSGIPSIIRIVPVAEFEVPLTLAEMMWKYFGPLGISSQLDKAPAMDVVIYRAAETGAVEEAIRLRLNLHRVEPKQLTLRLGELGDPAQWPLLQWGDIVVLEGSSAEILWGRLDELLESQSQQVKVRVGDRTQKVAISTVSESAPFPPTRVRTTENGTSKSRVVNGPQLERVWNPLAPLPAWRFSDLVKHAVEAEPRADLSAIRVQRAVSGKIQEWTVDLRAAAGVKDLPARVSHGDLIIIPVRASGDGEALAARRAGIFQAAPGRVFGERVFTWKEKDHGPRSLGDFLMQTYLASEMVIPDPDLSKVTIHRLKGDTGEEEHLLIDYAKIIKAGANLSPEEARKLDVLLVWGDIVELVPGDPPAKDWTGFSSQTQGFLRSVVARKVGAVGAEMTYIGFNLAEFNFAEFSHDGSARSILDRNPFSPKRANGGVPENEIVRYRVRSSDAVREFTPEELETIQPWLDHGDIVEVDRR